MKRFMSVLLSTAMALSAVPVSVSLSPAVEVSADEDSGYADATQYTYEISTILEPFDDYIYVKTDNPDPYSFAFADYDGVYSSDDDPAIYALKESLFSDVEYEDEETYRVNGGYIFYCKEGTSDGGELTLMQTTGIEDYKTTYSISTGGYTVTIYYAYDDTGITVTAPEMMSAVDYLIDTYTTDDMDFFEKMDAVQEALEDLAVYPRSVYDSDKPTGYYPALACSIYKELSLNAHYESIYEQADGLLLSCVYPFVLDSSGFPNMIEAVAYKLDSSAEFSSGSYHYQVVITYDGESKTYGGSGSGGNDPLYTEHVETLFAFDESIDDFSFGKTVEEYCSQLLSYEEVAVYDALYLSDLIEGTTYFNTISATGGTWIRVGQEGSSSSVYAYVIPLVMYDYVTSVSDAWVDGKYVNAWEYWEEATFDEHPTADIVITDMTYTDKKGNEHTQDVIFSYDSSTETWIASYWFTGYYSTDENIPDDFILTADEVADMILDATYSSYPESGLIYDGTEYPGTEFTNILVTGIEADEKVEVTVGRTASFSYSVLPEDATYSSVSFSSDDRDIAYVSSAGNVYGAGVGTTTITLTTVDGHFSTSMEVTVIDHIYSGDFVIDKINDTEAILYAYTGTDEEVVIPSELEGYQIIEIDDEAFSENETLRSVTVPEGVTRIGEKAFYNCTALETITLPDSLTEIDDYAFYGCSSLESIALPDSMTDIGEYAFYNCSSLETIAIPDGIMEIGKYTFYYCSALKSVTLPDGLIEIGDYAFYRCSSLESITLPDSLTKIGTYAFYYCSALESIAFPDGLTEIGSFAFESCSSLEDVILPESLTEIGANIFCFCLSFNSISLPSNLTTIGYGMFSSCRNMTSIWIPDTVTSIGDNAFGLCYAITDVYFEGTEEEWNAITIGTYNEYLTSATIHFNSASLPAEETGEEETDEGETGEGETDESGEETGEGETGEESGEGETDGSEEGGSSSAELEYTLGDVNEDGSINYLDAMMVLRYDAALITLTDEQLLAGDVNGDGDVNSLDAIKILRYDAGLIDNFS